jgi:hypothetical protein
VSLDAQIGELHLFIERHKVTEQHREHYKRDELSSLSVQNLAFSGLTIAIIKRPHRKKGESSSQCGCCRFSMAGALGEAAQKLSSGQLGSSFTL